MPGGSGGQSGRGISRKTGGGRARDMNRSLARGNRLRSAEGAKQILPCCGSTAWAEGMAARRPFADEATLLAASDETWRNLARADWMEAFRSHPRIGESRIGESRASQPAPAQSSELATQEQRDVAASGGSVYSHLSHTKQEYPHPVHPYFFH